MIDIDALTWILTAIIIAIVGLVLVCLYLNSRINFLEKQQHITNLNTVVSRLVTSGVLTHKQAREILIQGTN